MTVTLTAARRRTRRALALAATAALVAVATPGRTDRDGEETGERTRSAVTGLEVRVLRDPATGAKWLESPDGRRFESVAALVAAEDAGRSRLERALAPSLLARVNASAGDDADVTVIVRLRRQPAAEEADLAAARHGARLADLFGRAREIVATAAARRPVDASRGPDERRPRTADPREEETLLGADERAELASLRSAIRDVVKLRRREIVDAARPAAFADQVPVAGAIERIPGARVISRTFVVSAVCARIPVREIVPLLDAHPEIARIEPVTRLRGTLTSSVPVIGAGTWWQAGHQGTSGTKVAVLDTGIDSSHPALDGGVSDEAVFLSAAKSDDPEFADDESSTDDFHMHGTHIAGIVASRDSTYSGVAPGASVMNAKCGYVFDDGAGDTGASLMDADIMEAADWAASNGADVFNCSFGGEETTDGESSITQFLDAVVADLGISVAVAAGNAGAAQSVLVPADGFNVVTAGSWDDAGSTDVSDDAISDFSSQGPLDDGRRKPDLAAPGSVITSCDTFWETSGSDWIAASGTSMAAPHVAGGLALLVDGAVAANPEGLKALLVTSARNTSPFPSSPDDTWGFGALDLSAAYANRASVYEGSMTSGGARFVFLRPGTLAKGARVSLVWNRRVVSNGAESPTDRSALLDLDLLVFDESDGASRGKSESALNSVEQVAATSAANAPVVKVWRAASSYPSGLSTQGFAVAAESSSVTKTVAAPSLACTFTALPAQTAGTADFTVTVSVANSGGLVAQAPAVTLTVPTGYSIQSGANPQTITSVAAGGSRSATWTVRSASSGSGTKTFSAAASSASYGETFTSPTKTANQLLDVDAPTGSVTLAGGAAYTATAATTAAFSASDAGSGVTHMRFRTDPDAFGSWLTFAASASVTLTGGDGTKTFDVQFRDAVGNVSATRSDTIVLDREKPPARLDSNPWTTSRSVTLYVSWAADDLEIASVRLSADGTSWGAWSQFTGAKLNPMQIAWTLPDADGFHTVYCETRDGAGNVSDPDSVTIGLDRAAPSGSLTLDLGAAWTADDVVTVRASAQDAVTAVADMRFSDDGTNWSAWSAYDFYAPDHTLPGADGTKTLYVQYRDPAGNVSTSASATIGLDRAMPEGTIVVAGGAAWSVSATVDVALSASDATSGVAEMSFLEPGTEWTAWQAYAATASVALTGGNGDRTLFVRFRDAAGNVSDASSDTVGIDTVAPKGFIALGGGAAATSDETTTAAMSWSDATSGVAEMRFSFDSGATWEPWTEAAAGATVALPAADGPAQVRVQFRDVAGNLSTPAFDDIFVDRTAPTGTFVVAGGADLLLPGTPLTAAITADDTVDGSGIDGFRWSRDGGTNWSQWQDVSEGTIDITLPPEAADHRADLLGQFRDVARNLSETIAESVYVLALEAQDVTLAAGVKGSLAAGGDVDAYRLELGAGDVLGVKVKSLPKVRGAVAAVDLDLYAADGTRLVTGRFPASGKSRGITKFKVRETGSYLLVVRGTGSGADKGQTYTLTTSIAPKSNKVAGSVSAGVVEIRFVAAGDRLVAGTVSGLTIGDAVLQGPQGGPVALQLKGGTKGKYTLRPRLLAEGSGAYTLRVGAGYPAKWSLRVTLPKRSKVAAEK